MRYQIGDKVIIKATRAEGVVRGWAYHNDVFAILVDEGSYDPKAIEPYDLKVGDRVAVVSPSPFQTFIAAGYEFIIDKVGVDEVDFAGYEYHGKAVVKDAFSAAFHRQHVNFVSRPKPVDEAALAAINDRKSLVGHVNALKIRLHAARGEVKTLKDQLHGSTSGMANATAIIKRLQAAFNVFVTSAADWDNRKRELESVIDDQRAVIADREASPAPLGDYADLSRKWENQRETIKYQRSTIHHLNAQVTETSKRLFARDGDIAELNDCNDRQAATIKRLKDSNDEMTAELNGYRMQVVDHDADCQLQREVDGLRKEIAYRDKMLEDRGDTINRQAHTIGQQVKAAGAWGDQVKLLTDVNAQLSKSNEELRAVVDSIRNTPTSKPVHRDPWAVTTEYKPRLRFRLPWWRA